MYFVHVPKTAGTSFRKSAESYYGFEKICYDYSPNSTETTDIVADNIYKNGDYLSFHNQYKLSEYDFFSGHVHAIKYIDFFGVRDAVVFLRDPIQRVFSEYNHFVRHNGYQGDFKSFYTKSQFVNRQKKILSGVPLYSIGFVGITENYEASLSILNDIFQVDFNHQTLNKGRETTDCDYELDFETQQELAILNKEDIDLYKSSVELFNVRLALWKNKLPYVHGAVQQLSTKSISGWAWWEKNNESVVIEIFKDERLLGEARAQDFRPSLLRFGVPRNGYVGFHFTFSNELSKGDCVICKVKSTGQVIGGQIVES